MNASKPLRVWPDFIFTPLRFREPPMLRIDAFYLFQLGGQISPLVSVTETQTLNQIHLDILVAESAVDLLLHRSVFALKTS